jgi:hypothetical protein
VTATLASTRRAFHAITGEIDTPQVPKRGFVAEWGILGRRCGMTRSTARTFGRQ